MDNAPWPEPKNAIGSVRSQLDKTPMNIDYFVL
jgi:hypothetical protein